MTASKKAKLRTAIAAFQAAERADDEAQAAKRVGATGAGTLASPLVYRPERVQAASLAAAEKAAAWASLSRLWPADHLCKFGSAYYAIRAGHLVSFKGVEDLDP